MDILGETQNCSLRDNRDNGKILEDHSQGMGEFLMILWFGLFIRNPCGPKHKFFKNERYVTSGFLKLCHPLKLSLGNLFEILKVKYTTRGCWLVRVYPLDI